MNFKQRRSFLKQGGTGLALSLLPALPFAAQVIELNEANLQSGKDATRILAQYALNTQYEDIPTNIKRESIRSFVNYVGVTVGSCRHKAIDICIESLRPVSGSKQASILGRSERFDILNAAFINGVGSHILDFDDTHLLTNVHASGPIASALLAYSELKPVSGKEFMNAFYLGVEFTIRLSNALAPNHADIGWHVSGTHPSIGAAAAIGRLMRLTEEQMIWALGLAASQPVGFRDSFGSMNKSFNPGRAASNGVFSALLAQKGFTSSNQMIESRIGWANAMSTKQNYSELLGDLGTRFEIAKNTYKPFACGIVIHPAIDACAQLRAQGVKADDVERIELRVHPLVLELTGKKTPKDGLEGKFSVYHGCAVGLIFGQAGEGEYADDIVNRADVVALRAKVNATTDTAISEASVDVKAILKDGKEVHVFVKNAIGSVENPMSDANLEQKFTSLAEPIIGTEKTRQLISALWKLGSASDLKHILSLCTPD